MKVVNQGLEEVFQGQEEITKGRKEVKKGSKEVKKGQKIGTSKKHCSLRSNWFGYEIVSWFLLMHILQAEYGNYMYDELINNGVSSNYFAKNF